MALDFTIGALRFPSENTEKVFRRPVEMVTASRIREVLPSLDRVEAAVSRGQYAAGYLAYEAAPAFDPALTVHVPGVLPLLCFGIYDSVDIEPLPDERANDIEVGPWNPLLSEDTYAAAVSCIREHLSAGNTYQVNYTFPMEASFRGNSLTWFRRLCDAQGDGCYTYLDLGRFKILSASPELFLDIDAEKITTRPMKGTRPRGRWPEEDLSLAEALRHSEKERAENIMIVDMLRNDLGRISETGTVAVESTFDIERYETVWQMTSTIVSRTQAPLPNILAALFPSGSVTGAPKIETMKIIRALEPNPRGVYCGAIGWYGPDGKARFNVPIRTVTIDENTETARYAVGSGITWDSSTQAEYQECLDKAALLDYRRPDFELVETLRYDGEFFLIEDHLSRLRESAAYFGFVCDVDAAHVALQEHTHSLSATGCRIRLLLARNGTLRIDSAPLPNPGPLQVALAQTPVDSSNIFLYHKTTHRTVYDEARAKRPNCDDVILWNELGELTESTIANIVLDINGERYTPPIRSGLLGGTFRRHLLNLGEIRERPLTKSDLHRATAVHLINSVRKWAKLSLV